VLGELPGLLFDELSVARNLSCHRNDPPATFYIAENGRCQRFAQPDVACGDAKETLSEIGRDSIRHLVHMRAIALSGLMTLTAATAVAKHILPMRRRLTDGPRERDF